MRDERATLYSIGDFAGFCEFFGNPSGKPASEKKWRLMQVGDGLGGADMALLKKVQIEIYQPLIRRMVFVPRDKLSHSQRRQTVRPMREKIAPFFPGYAFLTFEETDQRWREVFKMVGIRGLVCANNNPVDVPWAMIEKIQAREVNGAVPSATKLAEFTFLIGENVRVTEGPFALFGGTVTELPKGLEGVDLSNLSLDQLDESFRISLLIDIFGRQTPVQLPVSQIEKV